MGFLSVVYKRQDSGCGFFVCLRVGCGLGRGRRGALLTRALVIGGRTGGVYRQCLVLDMPFGVVDMPFGSVDMPFGIAQQTGPEL